MPEMHHAPAEELVMFQSSKADISERIKTYAGKANCPGKEQMPGNFEQFNLKRRRMNPLHQGLYP